MLLSYILNETKVEGGKKQKMKKLKKGNEGITLVALVVTIVVLLILAGISLNLVLGQNGIISRAQDARNQTAEGKTNTEKAINALTDEMEAYVKGNESGSGNNGGNNGGTPADLSKYNIGDEVAYTYDVVNGGYSLTAAQSGRSSDQTVAQSSTTLKWKIINKDESTGTIDIVSVEPTSNSVIFQGALGYNNGVYLINDICEKLYSNTAKGIKARSINLEDMEKHLTDAGLTARNAYSGSNVKYGTPKTYTSSKQYPKLYASQIGAGITSTSVTQPDTVKTVDPYKESSKGYTTPTAETSDTAGDSGLTVTQTNYYIPINEANYGAAAAILANSKWFWVASRWVLAGSSYAGFGLRYAGGMTDVGGRGMFYSDGSTWDYNVRLRPLVSLSSSVLTGEKDTNGAWTIK